LDDPNILSAAFAALAALSPLEAAAVGLGVLYLLLAIRQNIWCWPAALVSVLLSLVLFYEARLYMEAALQVFYVAMALYGWQQWRAGRRGHAARAADDLPVSVWSARQHALAIGATLLMSAMFGWALAANTDAAFPYLDSFTSIAAIVTTYMVAKKILENWIYWFVIDGIGVYLHAARGLYLYAALFVLYLFLVVAGFVRWRRDWHAQPAHAAAN
jgi:nicotinamide mononucleotide transporter